MKISQEDVILITNLYLSKQCGTRRALSETWKLGSINSLLRRSHKTSTIVPLPGSVRPRLSRSSGGPCAQSGGKAKKASVSSLDFAWNCHSVFKCTQKNNSLWSPAHMLQMMSCSAVMHRCLHNSAHRYLCDYCIPVVNVAARSQLRSASRHQVVVLRYNTSTFGRRAFSVAGPTVWNSLLDKLRDPSLSIDSFRRQLKTFLFAD